MIDVEDVHGSSDTVPELDGGGNSDTAIVLRIAENLQSRSSSAIIPSGGLTPDRVLIYVKGGKCDFGNHFQGAGTLFCVTGAFRPTTTPYGPAPGLPLAASPDGRLPFERSPG